MKKPVINSSFQLIRNDLTNSALLGLFILIVPAVITSVLRSLNEGWLTVYYWHITASLVVITSWLFRKQTSFSLRSIILILLFYLTGISGYFSFGLSSFASVYFILVILFSVILFGYRPAFVALVLCFISLIGVYLMIHQRIIVYQVDFNKHMLLFSSWITVMVSFLMFSVMIILLVGKLHEKLNETLESTKTSEEKFRKIFENSHDAINVSKDGIQVMMNEPFLKMFGYDSQTELIGKPIFDVIHPASHNQVDDFFSQANTDITIASKYISQGVRKNGELITLEVAVTNYELNAEMYTLSIIRDISEQLKFEAELIKAKEKAEESDRLKSAFLANMSHEIRTPMNAIIGFSDILSNPNLAAEKRERFTKLIQQRSYDLLHIIEDILDVSKIEVGQMNFVESEFDLSVFMNDLYDFYRQKVQNMNKMDVNIKQTLPDNLQAVTIIADNYRLKQVFINLLDNALKFTDSGVIEFGCATYSENHITFFVSDTGIGIAPDQHEIIFDRFRQADEAITSKKHGGSGLGLSIVKGIIAQFKGKIWLESTPGKGTIFYFTIPLSFKNNQIVNPSDSINNDQPVLQNISLLIIEDDYANTEYLKEIFSDTGIHIFNAHNATDALAIMDNNPDLNIILVDIRLPDMNGLELTKKIRKKRPGIQIIAQTAYAAPVDMQQCFDAGCHGYIAKPIEKEKLFSMIGRLVNKTL